MPDDPLRRDDRLSMVERLAARRLASGPMPVSAPILAPIPAPIEAFPAFAAPEPPIQPAPPPPSDPVPKPADPARPPLPIDFDRLQAAGFITPTSPRSQQIECFRAIKRALRRIAFPEGTAEREANSNVIMVTSAVAGEGKTFVALNLAMSFCLERDLFVLLIDGDSHRRSLGSWLGAETEPGLVDLLAGDAHDVGDIIRRTSVPNLSVMPAGRPHAHGTELLSSKQMGALMRDVGARYADRIIIIDTAPVLATNEGVALSAHVGQTVLVVEKDATTKRNLREALAKLKGGRNLSCVFNRVTDEHSFADGGY